jgi:hypothetical protein
MSKTVSKTVRLQLNGTAIDYEVRRVVVAGYTGRDANQVRAHIVELEKHGIPAPPSFPTQYPLDASFATVDSEIVAPPTVSGEVEPGLLLRSNNLEDALVSVISDFTDREAEKTSIPLSKRHPKPFSSKVWKYSDVASDWDNIALRSWTAPGADRQLYQSGKFAQLLPPKDLLAKLQLQGDLAGTVILMGTVPLLTKGFQFTEFFGFEIERPDGEKLTWEGTLKRP